MTKAEYQAKYGAPPASSSAPVKMTRAEYDAKYGAPQPKNWLDRIKTGVNESAQKRAQVAIEASDANTSGKQGTLRSLFQIGGQVVGAALDPFVETAKAVTPEPVKQFIKQRNADLFPKLAENVNAVADEVSRSPLVQKFANSDQGAALERDVKAVQEYANLLPGPKVAVGTKTLLPKVIDVSTDTVKALTAKSEQQIESAIIKKFEKGVKPLLPGKTTPALLDRYRDDVVTAVKVIKENKANLSLTDEVDGVVTGQTPRSLQHLSEAVEQTKKAVFTKYDALAKTAGEAGVAVEMNPIAAELQTVISNRALAITNPRAIQYAEDLSKRLTAAGRLDATTAQEVIQNYNKSLEAFYRNPSYDTASQAAIDAMVANRLRTALDDGISGLTGQQYSALKAQYGALKSIEKDVIKASLRDARKGVKGLIDYTDIFSGGQVVSGILSLNPAQVASGLTQKSIAEFYKYLNNPNRAIEQMFKAADGLPSVNTVK